MKRVVGTVGTGWILWTALVATGSVSPGEEAGASPSSRSATSARTSVPTETQGAPDVLFEEDFESGDLEGWSFTLSPPRAVLRVSPRVGEAPLTVTFDGSLSFDEDGTVTRFTWDFGDGAEATGGLVDHTYPDPGEYMVTLKVRDDTGLSGRARATVRVTAPPPSPPQIDPPPAVTTADPLTLTGTAPVGSGIEIAGATGTVATTVDPEGRFQAATPLVPDARNRLFVVRIDEAGRRSVAVPVDVIHDTQPPTLFVDLPTEGTTTGAAEITVAGRVADTLSGSLGLDVEVQGRSANVVIGIGTNATFDLAGVALDEGDNTLQVTARDAAGNTAEREVVVTRVTPSGARLEKVAGDLQTGPAGAPLPEPLTVRVTTPEGLPFAGKLVVFEVTRSDGRLTSPGGEASREVTVRTDADGEASVAWSLGGDAGCANQRVTVRSAGIEGALVFTASGEPAAASQIQMSAGDLQRTEAGAPVPEPLRVWVTDGINGIPGVAVTFRVTRGGGTVEGSPEMVVETGVTGHAEAPWTLGPDLGEQAVVADFEGNEGLPVTFTARGLRRAQEAETTLVARVVDNAGRGIEGARCSLRAGGTAVATTSSDSAGECRLTGLPDGPARLHVDGLVATAAGGVPVERGTFPALSSEVLLVDGVENRLDRPILLPRLDPANARVYDGTEDVELTVEGIEGLRFTVRAGSMRRPDGTRPGPDDPAVLSLNPVHTDDIPMPMPDGVDPNFAWTVQPGGATFDPPVSLRYPNVDGLPPGSVAWFLSFDHATERFEIAATGRVTLDGAAVVSEEGDGLSLAGWGGACPPYPNRTTGRVEPPKVEEVVDECAEEDRGFFSSLLAAFRTQETVCGNMPSAVSDPKAYAAALERCQRSTLRCARALTGKARDLPGVVSGGNVEPPGPRDALGEGIQFIFDEARSGRRDPESLHAEEPAIPGTALATPSEVGEVHLLVEEAFRVPSRLPGFYAHYRASIAGEGEPDLIGEIAQVGDLSAYGFGPHSSGILEVVDVVGDNAIVDVYFMDLDVLPTVTVQMGNQTRQIDWPGGFSVPNVSAVPGDLLRPRITFQGVGVSHTLAPPTFADAVVRGTTTFPYPLPSQVHVPVDTLAATPALAGLTALGETLPLTVTAELADGTSADVTPRSRGTRYTSSNPAIASVSEEGVVTAHARGRALITVNREGVSTVVSVVVSPGDPGTTVEGFVRTPEGGPAPEASVRLVELGAETGTDGDGRFVFAEIPAEIHDTLTVTARDASTSGLRFAVAPDVAPVPGGLTDAGVLTPAPVRELADSDGDRVPDLLEEALGTDPATVDSDGDGVSDGEEDGDGDGSPDAAEALLGTDPTLPDSDGDGVADGAEDGDGDGLRDREEAFEGTRPDAPDTDRDGFSDREEIEDGSNPVDPQSLPPSLGDRLQGPSVSVVNEIAPTAASGVWVGGTLTVENRAPPSERDGTLLGPPFTLENRESAASVLGALLGPPFSVDNRAAPADAEARVQGPPFTVEHSATSGEP